MDCILLMEVRNEIKIYLGNTTQSHECFDRYNLPYCVVLPKYILFILILHLIA